MSLTALIMPLIILCDGPSHAVFAACLWAVCYHCHVCWIGSTTVPVYCCPFVSAVLLFTRYRDHKTVRLSDHA